MIEEIRAKLIAEVQDLNHELNVVLPETLHRARELGDLRENGDFQAAVERQRFVQARLNQLRDRLSKISSIDFDKVPKDRVGLGSTVTVVDKDTKDKEIFEIVIPEAMDMDAGHISVSSPLGQALLNRKVGDKVKVQLPFGKRALTIKAFRTIHEQIQTDA